MKTPSGPGLMPGQIDVRNVGPMANSAELSKLCFYAGGNRLVVPASQLAAFRRALKRMGYVLPGE